MKMIRLKPIIILFLGVVLFNSLFQANVYAVSCSAVFPNAANGHSNNSRLNIFNTGQVLDDPNYQNLPFESKNNLGTSPANSCGSGKRCQITGDSAELLDVPTFISTNSTRDESFTASRTINANNFRNLTIDGNSTRVTLKGSSPFRIDKLVIRNNATLRISAGIYHVGDLTLTNGNIEYDNSEDGPIILIVNNQLIVENTSANVNDGGDANNVLIFVLSSASNGFTMTGDSNFVGFVYTNGGSVFRNNSSFLGRVSSNQIEIDNSSISLSGDPDTAEFDDICGDDATTDITPPSGCDAGDFELYDCFSAASYNNSDGSSSWLTSWVENNDDNLVEQGDVQIVNEQLRIAGKNLGSSTTNVQVGGISRIADLSNYQTAQLSYSYRYENYNSDNDTVTLQIRRNSGDNWVELIEHKRSGTADNGSGTVNALDISSYISSTTEIRFITNDNQNHRFVDYLFIDNFGIDLSDPLCIIPANSFADCFNTVAYSNQDGDINWDSDWSEVFSDSDEGTGDIRIESGRLKVSGSGDFIRRTLDLSTTNYHYNEATVNIDYETLGMEAGERVRFEVTDDPLVFDTWDIVYTFETNQVGTANVDLYNHLTADSILTQDPIHIRFRARAEQNSAGGFQDDTDSVFIDQLFITGAETVDNTCDINGFEFLDCFGTRGYVNSFGAKNWVANRWTEAGDDNLVASGDIGIQHGHLILSGQNNSITREMDLSEYQSAELSFDYEFKGLDDDFDQLRIEISQTGGTNWDTLALLQGSSSAAQAQLTFDISNYISADTQVRLSTNDSALQSRSDKIYIDNFGVKADPIQISYYEIEHTGTTLTCRNANISVRACVDSDCTLYDQVTSATLTKTVSANTSILDANDFTGRKNYSLSQATAAQVTLGLTNLSPNANVVCKNQSGSVSNCNIIYNSAAFFITEVANAPSCGAANITIEALKDDGTGKCTPAYQGNKSVNFEFDYNSPNASQIHTATPATLSTTGTNTSANTSTNSYNLVAGTAQVVELDFDNNAAATATLSYNNAGRLSVNVSALDGRLQDKTSTVTFVPDSFALVASNDISNLNAGTESTVAGDDFTVRASAQCSNGTVTSNYEIGNLQTKVERIQPNAGGVDGELVFGTVTTFQYSSPAEINAPYNNINTLNFNAGIYQTNQARYSEAGAIAFEFKDNNYFNQTIGSTPVTIGRFIPAEFKVYTHEDTLPSPYSSNNLTNQGSFDNTIDTRFNYLGQSFGFDENDLPSVMVVALNRQGLPTQNYSLAFDTTAVIAFDTRKITAVLDSAITPNIPVNATFDFPSNSLLDQGNGSFKFTFDPLDRFQHVRTIDHINQIPFMTQIALNFDNNTFTSNTVGLSSYATVIPIGANMRSARLAIENSHGPETDLLALPIYLEYLTSANIWQTSTEDSITELTSEMLTIGDTLHAVGSNWNASYPIPASSVGVGAGVSVNLLTPASSRNSMQAANGLFNLGFSAPGRNNKVELPIEIDLTNVDYLMYDWDGDGALDSNINGLMIWGIYRANDRIFYWREN